MSGTEYSNRALAEALGYTFAKQDYDGCYGIFGSWGSPVSELYARKDETYAWERFLKQRDFEHDPAAIVPELERWCVANACGWICDMSVFQGVSYYAIQIVEFTSPFESMDVGTYLSFAEAASRALFAALQEHHTDEQT